MAIGLSGFLGRMRRHWDPVGAAPDAELLERFVRTGDQAAFEIMVWRHGAMVLNVCRRVLHREHAAEDAFQATFWILAKKAAGINRKEGLAGWLHRVAMRVAFRNRAAGMRWLNTLPVEAAREDSNADLRDLVDEALNDLPTLFRVPLVLSYLEGKSNEEIARELGVPAGTVYSRLARGRDRLRRGLERRGWQAGTLGMTLGAGAMLPGDAPAAGLILNTVAGAMAFRSASALHGAASVSTTIGRLAQGVMTAMWMQRVNVWAAGALTLALVCVGVGWSMPGLFAQAKLQTEGPKNAQPGGAKRKSQEVADPKVLLANELKLLKGLWVVEEMEMAGEKVPKTFAQKLKNGFGESKLQFLGSLFQAGNQWAYKDSEDEYDFAVDPAKKPKEIDITIGDKKVLGIYEIKKDVLHLCISYVDNRPKEMSSKGQEGVFLYVLKRNKEEQQPQQPKDVPHQRKEAPPCQDATAIAWFLPGQFTDAVNQARKEHRLLMVKGISFGVDAVGAKCATQGNW